MWKSSGELHIAQRGDLGQSNLLCDKARVSVQQMLDNVTGGAVKIESEYLDAGGIDFVLSRRSVLDKYEAAIIKGVAEQLGITFRVSRQLRQVPANINTGSGIPVCLGDAETLVVTRLAQPVRKYSMPMWLGLEAILAILIAGFTANALFILYLLYWR